jgi:hypothetical protein
MFFLLLYYDERSSVVSPLTSNAFLLRFVAARARRIATA